MDTYSAGGNVDQVTTRQEAEVEDRWRAAFQHADECLNEYCQDPKRWGEEQEAIKMLKRYNQGDRSAYLLQQMESLTM